MKEGRYRSDAFSSMYQFADEQQCSGLAVSERWRPDQHQHTGHRNSQGEMSNVRCQM